MDFRFSKEHIDCKHHIPNNEVGFKLRTPKQGDTYTDNKSWHHGIVFILDGKVELSYNEYIRAPFAKGDMVLIPQSSETYGRALEDSKILVLSFNNEIESYCDNCMISDYRRSDADMEYTFAPMRIKETLRHFCDLMVEYLSMDMQCSYMHQIKQKELLLLLRYSYTKQELVKFFLPMIGENMSFRNKVHKYSNEGLSVAELAVRSGMIDTLFAETFKREFGSSPYQWLLKQKRNQIAIRLSMPDTTISDITREFKFTDGSHFVKYCKKQFGCTPQELAKQLKGNNKDKLYSICALQE